MPHADRLLTYMRVLATAHSTRALLDLEARLEVTASHPGEKYIQYIVTFI
jgi:hypothetical protein